MQLLKKHHSPSATDTGRAECSFNWLVPFYGCDGASGKHCHKRALSMRILLQLQPVGTVFYARDGDQCTPFYGRDGMSALAVTHRHKGVVSTVLLLQKSINRLPVLMLESDCNWLAAFYARGSDQCVPFYSRARCKCSSSCDASSQGSC